MSWKETLTVRAWALRNVFLLFFIKPRVLEISDDRCEIVIPLTWRTRRHDIRAMYLGAMCMGADVAGGLIAFRLATRTKAPVAFVFKDIRGEFFRRAEGDVHFICEDGPRIRALFQRTVESGERQEETVTVTAMVPTRLGRDPAARFNLTLSLKKRA